MPTLPEWLSLPTGREIGVAGQKINPSCSVELVCAGWREADLS